MAQGDIPEVLVASIAQVVTPPTRPCLSQLFASGMLDRYVRPFSYLLMKEPHWTCKNIDGVTLTGVYCVVDGAKVKLALCRTELDAAVIVEALRTWSINSARRAVAESRTPPPTNPEQIDVT